MSNIVPPDVMAFDVEQGLKKALGSKVETYVCGPTEYKFRIGLRWNLILNKEQLSNLWDYVSNPPSMREQLDQLKAECLVFQSVNR